MIRFIKIKIADLLPAIGLIGRLLDHRIVTLPIP
jgi:hypothetical protein